MHSWLPISDDAPMDGRLVRLGWLPNDRLEYEVVSFWDNGRWSGEWTPTHWKPKAGKPVYPKGKQ